MQNKVWIVNFHHMLLLYFLNRAEIKNLMFSNKPNQIYNMGPYIPTQPKFFPHTAYV